MKLYLGKFTLEGTPLEIKEVLDLMNINYTEIPISIPNSPSVPVQPFNPYEPWTPYNPNFWWLYQPYCVTTEDKPKCGTGTVTTPYEGTQTSSNDLNRTYSKPNTDVKLKGESK